MDKPKVKLSFREKLQKAYKKETKKEATEKFVYHADPEDGGGIGVGEAETSAFKEWVDIKAYERVKAGRTK